MNDNAKKQVPLRLSPKLYAAIAAWAEDDFRSVKGRRGRLSSICSNCMEIRSSVSLNSDINTHLSSLLSITEERLPILLYRKSRAIIPCLNCFYSRRLICSMEAVCASVIFLRES